MPSTENAEFAIMDSPRWEKVLQGATEDRLLQLLPCKRNAWSFLGDSIYRRYIQLSKIEKNMAQHGSSQLWINNKYLWPNHTSGQAQRMKKHKEWRFTLASNSSRCYLNKVLANIISFDRLTGLANWPYHKESEFIWR
jgi:hypothetical protein